MNLRPGPADLARISEIEEAKRLRLFDHLTWILCGIYAVGALALVAYVFATV